MRDQEQGRTEQKLRATTSRQGQRRRAVAAAWAHIGFLGSVINESKKSELVSSEPRDAHKHPTLPWGPRSPSLIGTLQRQQPCQLLQELRTQMWRWIPQSLDFCKSSKNLIYHIFSSRVKYYILACGAQLFLHTVKPNSVHSRHS